MIECCCCKIYQYGGPEEDVGEEEVLQELFHLLKENPSEEKRVPPGILKGKLFHLWKLLASLDL